MNPLRYIIPGILFFFSCQSQSDKILEDFRKVNESLEKINEAVDSSSEDMELIGFEKSTADSIDHILKEAFVYFINLKIELENLDKEGEKLDVAQKLLLKTPKGDSLFNHLKSVYDLGIKYRADSSERQKFILLKDYDKDKWLEKYFKMVPTVAAATMMSKFRNDCITIRMIVRKAGIRELNKATNE